MHRFFLGLPCLLLASIACGSSSTGTRALEKRRTHNPYSYNVSPEGQPCALGPVPARCTALSLAFSRRESAEVGGDRARSGQSKLHSSAQEHPPIRKVYRGGRPIPVNTRTGEALYSCLQELIDADRAH